MNNVQIIQDKRRKISRLIDVMKDMPQTECPVTHRFEDGLYIREIFMPEDTYVIGKIHTAEHWNIILTGCVTVITATSKETFKAPHTFISGAGVQKIVYMHTDCIWQTLHVTDKTDLDEIEKDVIVEDYDQLEIDSLLEEAKRLEL